MSDAPTLLIRPVACADAPALAELLNAIIAAGGTTALEEPFTPGVLDACYLTGPEVICCHVAEDDDGTLLGFQTLGHYPGLPDGVGDIGTFARIGMTGRGVGGALFAATIKRAGELGLSGINATIRADNASGLAFYTRLGFADHGVTPAVPLEDGTPVDRVHKRFALEAIAEAEIEAEPEFESAFEEDFEDDLAGAADFAMEPERAAELETSADPAAKPKLTLRPAGSATTPPLQRKGRGWNIAESRLDTLHDTAREMRRNPSAAHVRLADALTAANLGKYRFRSQTVIGSAIVDFACQPLRMAIALDEEADPNPALSRRRDKSLEEVGIKVLRIPAAEVLANTETVVQAILADMKARYEGQRARPSYTQTRPATAGRARA
ncbi:GNAT family N-acetyltransferase, partial [Novosphingobium sp. Chol11]|uniref:GNAT family N-acetyltransferase n=1 Tax=Novosphingobium sp. Chol11 TaxID=1385763 RepID=UPI0025F8A779